MTHSSLHSHKPLTLDQYFHLIVNKQPQKELTMLETLKAKWTEFWTTRFEFTKEEPATTMDEDYWAFEMVTHEWIDEHGVTQPIKHTCIIEPHEGTWMEVLDRILDELEKHYGYNIKEQVYYSVNFPCNEIDYFTGKPCAGYGRCLNDEVLQKLLLSFPEVYEFTGHIE